MDKYVLHYFVNRLIDWLRDKDLNGLYEWNLCVADSKGDNIKREFVVEIDGNDLIKITMERINKRWTVIEFIGKTT